MSGDRSSRLVVLDRDGVINRDSANFIRSADEWLPLPGSIRAIADLTRAGFSVVVASNQSGIGRGYFSTETLAAIDARMTAAVESAGGRLAGTWYCPHLAEDGCQCRKPRAGLLRQIEAHFDAALRGRPVVGDSYRDLEAAWEVGARAILVLTGNGHETRQHLDGRKAVEVLPDLAAVAALLTSESPCRQG